MNNITISESTVLIMLARIEQLLETYPILITQLQNLSPALAEHDNAFGTLQGASESVIQAFKPHIEQLERFREILKESLK